MRFKLDENIAASIGRLLDDLGHDVHTAIEESLSGSSDARLLEAATAEGRMLVTFDLDFADLRIYPAGHPGVVVLRLRDQSAVAASEVTRRVFSELDVDEFAGHLVIVTETLVRIRSID